MRSLKVSAALEKNLALANKNYCVDYIHWKAQNKAIHPATHAHEAYKEH